MKKTIEQIEKRRRQLHFLSYFLIYFLALSVVGLFFFIDDLINLFGLLKYNLILRLTFVSFISFFIFYLAHKEREQADLTKDIVKELEETNNKLVAELQQNQFLYEVRRYIVNLKDPQVLARLFKKTINFLQADGGVVILKAKAGGWHDPLVVFPQDFNTDLIKKVTKLITKTGRSLLQPDPEFPEVKLVEEVASFVAVPIRLESRLYGALILWKTAANSSFQENDLKLLKLIAQEAAGSAHNIQMLQERTDQFKGILSLLAKAAAEKENVPASLNLKIARLAKEVAAALRLPEETQQAVEMAALIRPAGLFLNGHKDSSQLSGQETAAFLQSLKFPRSLTSIISHLEENYDGSGSNKLKGEQIPIGTRILAVCQDFAQQANPLKGRPPSPAKILEILQKQAGQKYDPKVIEVLSQLLLEKKLLET